MGALRWSGVSGTVTHATLVRRERVTDRLAKFWLEPAEPYPFQPGQFCVIGLEGIERAYSIVSAPSDPLLELFVELVPRPEGHLTPLLFEAAIGSDLTLRPHAKGRLLWQTQFTHHVMLATVTGIAPFVSMLRDGAQRYWAIWIVACCCCTAPAIAMNSGTTKN